MADKSLVESDCKLTKYISINLEEVCASINKGIGIIRI